MASTKETPKRKFGRKKSLHEIALERLDNPNEDLEYYDLVQFSILPEEIVV